MRPRHRRIAETRIRGSNTLVRRGSEALPATLAQRELLHLDHTHDGDGRDHELGDPHPGLDGERCADRCSRGRRGSPRDSRVDQPRRVHDADPVTGRESRSRQHEAGMTRGISTAIPVGTVARSPGRASCPHTRRGRGRHPRVRVHRQDGILAQTTNRYLDHDAEAFCSCSPATRKRANRAISGRGRRARTRTPSGVSRRSAMGAPSS